jgi:hypothetical protein
LVFLFVLLRKSASAGSSKATEPHPCLRTKRKSGLAVLRFGVKPHPCIIGLWDCRPCPSHSSPTERAQLLANGEARAAGQAIDPLPVVRLFTPDAHVTWLLAALDPADGDTAWGLIDLGSACPRWAPSSCPTWRHRRAAQAARDARSISAHAHAVGIHRLAERDGAIPD